MSKAVVSALIAAIFGISACSSNDKESRERNPAPCPNVIALGDASRVIEFAGEDQTLDNIAYTGEIVNVTSVCRYFGDNPIDASVEVELAFGKGPKGENGEKYFKYFVAVTRTDLEVIAKENFVVPVDFSDKRRIVVKVEDIDKIGIPRATEQISGSNFEIIVGFALTPQQAIFNRSGKSLKFPELQ